jgi:hypothetical protein
MVEGEVMHQRLKDFEKHLLKADTDAFSESVVRKTLEGISKDCPMTWLLALGQRVVELGSEENRQELESN